MSQPRDRCRSCGRAPAQAYFNGDGPLCDSCYDEQVSAALGLRSLGGAPAPTEIADPDGDRHVLRYRVVREPAGIVVELREVDVADDGSGYQFAVIADHDADVAELVATVREQAQREIGRRYLRPAERLGGGWDLTGDEVCGRIEPGPHRSHSSQLIIDGQAVSWQQLGDALAPFEGFRLRLAIEEDRVDQRTEKSEQQD